MRYTLESMLPERAFQPRGGRFGKGMTLEGGGNPISAVTDSISSVLGTDGGGGGILGGLADLDKFVGNEIPGGWVTVGGLAAGGAALAYAPEIMAFAEASGLAPEAAAQVLGAPALDTATGAMVNPATGLAWEATGSGLAGNAAGVAGSSFTPEMIAYANASADPIAAINAMSGMSPAEFTAAMSGTGGAGTGIGSTISNALGGITGSNMLAPALLGGANLAGSLMGASASRNAAQAQADAANKANDLTWRMYQQGRADQMPWLQAGGQALNQLSAGLAPGGQFTKNFTAADMAAGVDPGYAFRMSEGLKALDRQAAARGGLISGAALKGAQRYGQDMASQEYQNAFNRYQVNRSNLLNPLQSLAGVGQSTANTLAGQGAQTASTMGENTVGAGNARASGYIGQTNAYNQGITGIGNLYSQNALLNALTNRG